MVPPSGLTSLRCPPPYAGAAGGGGSAAGAAGGGAFAPIAGGATPSIVPFSLDELPVAPAGAAPGGAGAGPGRGAAGGAFIISMVPLNFGAAAPLRLKPHLLQVFELSSFSVPQFGQNTLHLRNHPLRGLSSGSVDGLTQLFSSRVDFSDCIVITPFAVCAPHFSRSRI